jgi:hypothetical protein
MGEAVIEKVKGVVPQIIVLRILHDRVAIAEPIMGNGHDLSYGSHWTVGDHLHVVPEDGPLVGLRLLGPPSIHRQVDPLPRGLPDITIQTV